MIKSESIAKLAEALSKAQGSEAESDALHLGMKRHVRYAKSESLMAAFLDRIAFTGSECWFWVGSRVDVGYGVFMAARASHGSEEVMAHRIAWKLFRGDVPKDLNVLHRCDVRACVNPDHLFLGTQLDNMRDCRDKGRNRSVPQYGEANPMARLTEIQVAEIRSKRGSTSQNALARSYGVSPMTISRIMREQTWRQQ